MTLFFFLKAKKSAFTLAELLITISIIVFLSSVTVVFLNPEKIFADGRNTQRKNDLNNISIAMARYVASTDTSGNLRHLYDLINYIYILSDVGYDGSASCGNASINGITGTVSGAYDLAATGSGALNLDKLVTNGMLNKVPKDPTNVNYKVCMDPANSYKLVLYAPVKESSSSTYVSTVLNIDTSPNINYIPNPSTASDNNGVGQSNNTLSKVSSGSSYLTNSGNLYWKNTPMSGTCSSPNYLGQTCYMQAIVGMNVVVPNATYTFSVDVDKGTYTGVMHLELKDYNGNWDGTSIVITTPGRYSVTRTLRSGASQMQASVSGDGQGSGDTLGSFYFDNAQLEFGGTATNYFDGDSGSQYGWVYTPHFHGAYKLE